jgi:hypothetical protein
VIWFSLVESTSERLLWVCRSASKERHEKSERTNWALVVMEFSPIYIYLVISPLVSLISLGVPFPFASNSSTYPKKMSAYKGGLLSNYWLCHHL